MLTRQTINLATILALIATALLSSGGMILQRSASLSEVGGLIFLLISIALLLAGASSTLSTRPGLFFDRDQQALTFKSSAFEGSSVAMMSVDRDFKIVHVNDATKALLKEHETIFREVWPTFRADNILGLNIDFFHKNPAHQRALLSSPDRLPFRTDISIGDLKFALNVSGVFDRKGAYIGNVLEWDNVTIARRDAGAIAAIDEAQCIMEFALDGTILNANQKLLDV